MKKLLVIILIGLCLVSCSKEPVSIDVGEEPEVYWCTHSETSRSDGMYFLQDFKYRGGANNTLCYADFANCIITVACPQPNCPHTDPDTCYALGVTNGAGAVLPHGGKIYWLFVEDGYTTVFRANADGTERRKVCKIEEKDGFSSQLCAVGEKMYFLRDDKWELIHGDDGSLTMPPRSSYIYSFDFETNTAEQLYDLIDLFPNTDRFLCGIDGVWDGGIYIGVTALRGEWSATRCELRYDIELGTLEKLDFEPWKISGEYMVLREGSSIRVKRAGGGEYFFKDVGASILMGARVVNDKLFVEGVIIELETGKRFKNLCAALPGPIAFLGGKYLIYDDRAHTLTAVEEDKLVGKALD